MTDWAVWPIFTIQALAFILLFFKPTRRFLGMSPRIVAMVLLLISCLLIALSLNHDSTEVLHLHF